MSGIIPKWQMTEEDIKLNFITPALSPKWNGRMTMETQITDGKINLRGNLVSRAQPKRADYVLYINANNPIAIVEAKDNQHAVADGLQQAMTYAQMLDVPFAYSSNGDAFREHDFLMGTERDIAMEDFPTPDELYRALSEGRKRRRGPDAGRGGHHRAAVLFEPEHLSAPLLSARRREPHAGRHRPRAEQDSACHGDGHGQDLHRVPDRLPPAAQRHEKENPVSG